MHENRRNFTYVKVLHTLIFGTRKNGPRKNGSRKMVPGKKIPGKLVPGKSVPGKCVPGKMVPGKMSFKNCSPSKEYQEIGTIFLFSSIDSTTYTKRCLTFTSRSYMHQTVEH